MSNKELIVENDYQKFYKEQRPTYTKVTYTSNPGVIVILCATGGLFFINQISRETNESSFEFIRGFIEYGESPESAAIREVDEELGVNIESAQLFNVSNIGIIHPDNALTNQKIYVEVIQLQSNIPSPHLQTSEGVVSYHWLDKSEISEKIPQITDSLTLAALAKLQLSK